LRALIYRFIDLESGEGLANWGSIFSRNLHMQGVEQISDYLPGIGGYDPAMVPTPIATILILPPVREVGCCYHQISLLIATLPQELFLKPEIAHHGRLSIYQNRV
jgi:hypothetical protein